MPLRSTVTRHAVEELTEQLLITAAAENAIDYPVEEDLGTLIMIRNNQNRTLRVNINNCTCSCGYVESQGLLCRHLLFMLKKTLSFEQLAHKALQTAHPRWTTATLNRAMDVTILPAVVSRHNNVPWHNTQAVPSTGIDKSSKVEQIKGGMLSHSSVQYCLNSVRLCGWRS